MYAKIFKFHSEKPIITETRIHEKKKPLRKDTNNDKKVVGVMGKENYTENQINVKYEFWMMQ